MYTVHLYKYALYNRPSCGEVHYDNDVDDDDDGDDDDDDDDVDDV